MRRGRAFLFALLFYPGSVVAALLLLAISFSPRLLRGGAKAWAGWFLFSARLAYGIRLVVRGPVPESGLVAVKHQSMYETIAMLFLLPDPVVIMKKELRRIPIWGWLAERHGAIFVERTTHARALKAMLRAARRHQGDGRPVVIFPEGTRVPVGESPPLKAGVSALYQGLGAPVTPVALDAGKCWRRDGRRLAGVVTIAFLPAIPPNLPRNEAKELVRQAINLDPRQAATSCAILRERP